MVDQRYWGVRGTDGRWIGARKSAAHTKQHYSHAVVVMEGEAGEAVASFHNTVEAARRRAKLLSSFRGVARVEVSERIDARTYREIMDGIELAELSGRIERLRARLDMARKTLADVQAIKLDDPVLAKKRDLDAQVAASNVEYYERRAAGAEAKLAKLSKKYGAGA